jgi:hypothetical protein
MGKGLNSIRKNILKRRGVVLTPQNKNPIPYLESPTTFPKTQMMKYVELKFGIRIETLLEGDSIYDVAKKLNIDPTTVSKWRKRIRISKIIQHGIDTQTK